MTPIEPEDRVEVLIVGAGFSGLCLGARLVREGRRDFVILEKGDSVGGTWRDNRYPGCACDIPSHLYSLSFGPRPDWSRYYPTQPELFAYLEEVARHFDLGPHLRLNTAFADAEWDANESVWRVRTRDGRLFKAAVLVSAIGALHVREKPAIAGIETFPGAVFHSAEWPADFDATGRRIAVVGTGASAIQFVPELAKRARSLTLFQRTAPWVLPKFDRPIGGRAPAYAGLSATAACEPLLAARSAAAGLYRRDTTAPSGAPSWRTGHRPRDPRHGASRRRDPGL